MVSKRQISENFRLSNENGVIAGDALLARRFSWLRAFLGVTFPQQRTSRLRSMSENVGHLR